MNENQKAAFLMCMVACANARIHGYTAENQMADYNKLPPPYSLRDFEQVVEEFQIHSNAAITYLSGG